MGRRRPAATSSAGSRRPGRSGTTVTATPCATRGSAGRAAAGRTPAACATWLPAVRLVGPLRRDGRSVRVGQLRHRARRLHAARPRVVRPQAQRGERRGQPRRHRQQPLLGLRRGRADRRRRGPRAAAPDAAQPARDPADVDRRADAHGRRRDGPHSGRQQQRVLPSTTRPPGSTGSTSRGRTTCSPGPARCSRSGRPTRCCATTGLRRPARAPDGTKDLAGSAPTARRCHRERWFDHDLHLLGMYLSGKPAADGTAPRPPARAAQHRRRPARRPAARQALGARRTTCCSTPRTSARRRAARTTPAPEVTLGRRTLRRPRRPPGVLLAASGGLRSPAGGLGGEGDEAELGAPTREPVVRQDPDGVAERAGRSRGTRRRSGAGRPRTPPRAAATRRRSPVSWSSSSTRPCTTWTSTSSGDSCPSDTNARTSRVLPTSGASPTPWTPRRGRPAPTARPPAPGPSTRRAPWPPAKPPSSAAAGAVRRGVQPDDVVADHPAGQHLRAEGAAACAGPSRSSGPAARPVPVVERGATSFSIRS